MILEEKYMINKLMKVINNEDIESRLDKLWNDPYISKQMLNAHLNPDIDAASRKMSTIERSAIWIEDNIKNKSKILDLGCGPGLYAVELAKKGHSVVGVDLSAHSINYAKKQNKQNNYNIKYINKNYLDLDYENEFDVVLLIYKDFSALGEIERDKLLNIVYKALKNEGQFIFDVTQYSNQRKRSLGKTWSVNKGGFWTEKDNLVLEERIFCNKINTLTTKYIVLTDDNIKSYVVLDKEYKTEEIKKLLSKYSEVSIYANVCGEEYDKKSDEIAIIAKK
jgi:SAM-dependent methyltransferase